MGMPLFVIGFIAVCFLSWSLTVLVVYLITTVQCCNAAKCKTHTTRFDFYQNFATQTSHIGSSASNVQWIA